MVRGGSSPLGRTGKAPHSGAFLYARSLSAVQSGIGRTGCRFDAARCPSPKAAAGVAESVSSADSIAAMSGDRGRWTAAERAREERAQTARSQEDREKSPEERLEETLSLSRLVAELQQGVTPDVPGR